MPWARKPNSWPIICHRTWTRELAVSSPITILHVGGGRSSPRYFWCFWYDELENNWVMTNWPSSLKTFLLRLQVRRTLKGGFLCAACLLLVAEIEWPSHCKCELVKTEQKSIGEHRHKCLCVNFWTLTLMEMNCK